MGVKDPNKGCLQDIHWSMGLIGYFPTYSLGNLMAAQLFAKAQEDIPSLEGNLKEGVYGQLLQWLRGKVHEKGASILVPELIELATGEATNPEYHLEHLRNRYLS